MQRAKADGQAVALGHPYPETIEFLQNIIPDLADYGVRLVPVSQLIAIEAGHTGDDGSIIDLSMSAMSGSDPLEGL